MLTPQEVLMHAQAVLLPGRKPPAMEGSYECYPCRVIRIGEIGSFEALNGSLCARHEKAVCKLLKLSFASGGSDHPPQALVEQRRALLTAVVAARERRDRSSSIDSISSSSSSYTSSGFMPWHPSSSSNASSSSDSDSGSDSAVEDDDMTSLSLRPTNTPVVTQPWRGAPRLPTVVESDEEGAATPREAAFGST